MWNPFKKKSKDPNDPNQMGFVQKLAMKKIMNMSDQERMKLMQKMMTPENIAKNKDKILGMMDNMKKSGQISADQYEMIKQKLGIR